MEYCGIELTEEGLKHYGIKGMHWGIRRYQPYPDGKHGNFLKKRQAKKLIKTINKNEKIKGKREFYMHLSNNKSEELEKAGKYDKAAKQLSDAKEHARSIEEIRNLTKHYIKQLTDSGYNVDSKVKSSMRQAGRMMIDKYMLAGKNDNGKGKAHVQTQMMDNKRILNKQIQKAPKTDRAMKLLEKNGDKMATKLLNSEKMNNKLNAIDQMMKKSIYAEEYERAKKGTEQIQKDYNLPTYEELRAKAAKQSSTNLVRGGRLVTVKQPKTISSQDRIDDAYKKAESIQVGHGAGSVDMSHPAVKWAIKEAKKNGSADPEGFIKREGEPPQHDDWAHVILDYEKSKKKK